MFKALFRPSSIAGRVRLTVVVATALLLIPLGMVEWNLTALHRDVTELTGIRTDLADAANELEINLLERALGIVAFVNKASPESLEQIQVSAEDYAKFRDVFAAYADRAEVTDGVRRLDLIYAEFDRLAEALVAQRREMDTRLKQVETLLAAEEAARGLRGAAASPSRSVSGIVSSMRRRFEDMHTRGGISLSASGLSVLDHALRTLEDDTFVMTDRRGRLVEIAVSLDSQIDEILQLRADRELEESSAATLQSVSWLRLYGVGLMGVLIVALLITGALVVRHVRHPLDALSEGMRRVSGNDLSARLPQPGPSEFAEVVDRFNDMVGLVEATQNRLRALSARVESLREEERGRIAREIHDELGQLLMAVRLIWGRFRTPEDVKPDVVLAANAEAMDLLAQLSLSTKRIVSDLRPAVLDHLGLPAAVEWAAEDFERRSGIQCDVAIDARADIPPALSTPLFRVLQESLTNVVRHASATCTVVRLTRSEGRIAMAIEDDGVGIQEHMPTSAGSFGILGMEERMRDIGGRLSIGRRPEGGTVVLAEVFVA